MAQKNKINGTEGIIADGKINVASILFETYANGPGKRICIWLQGCKKRCPGCYNKDFREFTKNRLFTPQELFDLVKKNSNGCEGISLSGGEPLLQFEILKPFLKKVRDLGLSVLSFTGYYFEDLSPELQNELPQYVDVLIEGPFEKDKLKLTKSRPMLSTINQKMRLLTDRYKLDDFYDVPDCEIFIEDNKIIVSGFVDEDLLSYLKEYRKLPPDLSNNS